MYTIRKMSGKGDTQLVCQTIQDVEDNLMENINRGWRIVGKRANGDQESVFQGRNASAEKVNQICESRNQEFQEYLLVPSITAG
jgi:hypothetical protein